VNERVTSIQLPDTSAFAVAAAAGVVLWVGASLLGGRREAWDGSLYWAAAYPIGIGVGGVMGFLASNRPWRWGLTLMLAQAVTLAAMTFSFGLLPLGMILFSVMAIPPMLAAIFGAWLRTRVRPAS
jgi:hypothetical protein